MQSVLRVCETVMFKYAEIMKVLNYRGVLNVGGKSQSVYNFVKKYNKKIKKIYAKKLLGHKAPRNISMNIKRFKKLTDD